MKKLLVLAVCMIALSSCYNTRILVGDVKPNEPLTEVNRVWNHHLIAGLVPLNNAKMQAGEYVGDRPNYVVKTNQSFLNQLVTVFTCGIYTPTQTVYYIPLRIWGKSNR